MFRRPMAVILACISPCCIAGVAQASFVPWHAEDGGNGHSYQVFSSPEPIPWATAQTIAQSHGGYLATITSAAEQDFVYSLALANPAAWEPASSHPFRHGPWLGGFQVPGSPEPGGGWQWITGEAFSYSLWDGGEPNDAGGENFIHFHGLGAAVPGGWNDIAGVTPHVYGYVVEINIPEPASAILLTVGAALLLRVRRRAG